MGEVPMLEHRGAVLCQSGVILDYLAETLGRFGPANAVERREILRWLLWDNHKLTSYTATYRFMRTFVKNPDPRGAGGVSQAAPRRRGACSMRISSAGDTSSRDRLTIADISLVGYLFFDDEIGVDWSAYPAIRDWLARITGEPRWVHPYELMPGHPLPADLT